MILTLSVFAVLLIGIISPSYADYISPKKQIESGVLPEDIQCREGKVLVIRDNGSPACITEKTAQKKGWDVIATEFNIMTYPDILIEQKDESQDNIHVDSDPELYENSDSHSEPSVTSTIKPNSNQKHDDYLNSLKFGLVSDEPFEGELYGFDQNLHLRQPAPMSMQHFFAPNHYSMSIDDLTGRDNLDHIIPQSMSADASLASGVDSSATIDYREWLPTYVAPGYYLKWVDITQPEDQYHSGSEGKGEIKFTYIPNNLDISEDITNKDFIDLNVYAVSIIIAYDESTIYMRTSSEINEITRGGTATDIVYENKWNGYIEYVYQSRSDPAKHSVAYDSPKISIASGGNALTMQEHEDIVTELFERYSNR